MLYADGLVLMIGSIGSILGYFFGNILRSCLYVDL